MKKRSFRVAPNPDRQALLLRVGIDKGTGGTLGPIFPDGSFDYVPIPEDRPAPTGPMYADLRAHNGGSLARLVPLRLAHRRAHIDPDFHTLTYGDAATRKRAQLGWLRPGDLLVFYAGLAPAPPDDAPRLFAIGYLTVKQVHRLTAADIRTNRELWRRFGTTAHFRRWPPDPALTLVEGRRDESCCFTRAVPLGDARQRLLGDLAAFGYQGSLLRAVGHWLRDGAALRALAGWLDNGPASLINDDTRLWRIAPSAIAPARGSNNRGDLVLADERLRVGDWVVAMSPALAPQIVALARINRLASGLPHRSFASLFWHFSARVPAITSQRRGLIVPPRVGAMIGDSGAIGGMVAWMAARFRIGFHS